jgi:hypothetical protein
MSVVESLQTHWQVVRVGDGFEFIAPDHLWKRRWGERAA